MGTSQLVRNRRTRQRHKEANRRRERKNTPEARQVAGERALSNQRQRQKELCAKFAAAILEVRPKVQVAVAITETGVVQAVVTHPFRKNSTGFSSTQTDVEMVRGRFTLKYPRFQFTCELRRQVT